MKLLSLLPALLVVLTLQTGPTRAQTAPQAPDRARIEGLHDELRAVKARLVAAVNKKDSAALTGDLSKDVAFTAINNDTIIGVDKIKAYYDRMMLGSGSFLNDFSISAEADDLSKLYANETIAITTGRADVMLDLRGGSQMRYSVPTRWTATLDRSTGQWKLAAIHFSADLSDNPYLTALSTFWKWIAAGVGLVALAIGFFLGRRGRAAK